MAKILYPQVITEDLDDLKELERYYLYGRQLLDERRFGSDMVYLHYRTKT